MVHSKAEEIKVPVSQVKLSVSGSISSRDFTTQTGTNPHIRTMTKIYKEREMDFSTMLDDTPCLYTAGTFENASIWLKLILAILCRRIPLNGCVMRFTAVYKHAPEVDNREISFVDGLNLLDVRLVYAIPVFILYAVIYSSLFLSACQRRTGHGLGNDVRVSTEHCMCTTFAPC
jgi:hypothetical protein